MAEPAASPRRVTAPAIALRKGAGSPIVMVTAYDAPSARVVDGAGVDVILVGDSVANVVLGYADTLQVTIDDMAHHVAAVARTEPRALVASDLKGGLRFGELLTDGRSLLLVGSDGKPSPVDSLSLLWHAYWMTPECRLTPGEVIESYDRVQADG